MLLAILGIAGSLHAAPVNQSFEDVIQRFIGSYVHTDYKKMRTVLSQDVYQRVPREKMVYKHKYNDILKGMKVTGMTLLNCTWDYKILAQNEGMVLARINYYYEDQTVSDFITLERDARKDWKVTGINRFFAPASQPGVLSVN